MKITSVDAIDFIVWVNNECIEKIVLAVVKVSVKAPLYDKIELPPLRESERAQSLMYRILRKSTENFFQVLLEAECYRECVLYTY